VPPSYTAVALAAALARHLGKDGGGAEAR